ncbi:MAG: threonine synthase [bacterium]|nr:threonine synthase [bacterium]
MRNWAGVIREYRAYLPVTEATPVVTLNEGNTPLVFAGHVSELVGNGHKVYLKLEGLNPTGSFKDRGMTVAVSRACEEGAKAIMCASTGNTSASAAAYAARGGLMCIVLIPEGKIALGKLAQALIHGARVIQLEGNFDAALEAARALTSRYPVTLVNSVNPYRLEGQKTAAFEVCDQLGGRAPDYHFLPVGNAGNISAYWMGYKEYFERGVVGSRPRMMGWQAAGAAPIVEGRVIERPETVATAIRIGNPASWRLAERARDESGGVIEKVSDEEILGAYRLLAEREGIFCEPASAASVAGVLKLRERGFFRQERERVIVCTLTGNGLKDPNMAISQVRGPVTLPADTEVIARYLGL